MNTPPERDQSPKPVFQAGTPNPQQPKRARNQEENDSLIEDVVEEIAQPIITQIGCGCLFKLVLLPFRIIWNIIENIFD